MTQSIVQQAAHLPLVGPWIGRIGQVANIVTTPCAVSPEIWVEAAWQNLPHLMFGFLKPFRIAHAWQQHTPRGRRMGLTHRASRGGKSSRGTYKAVLNGMLNAVNDVPAGPGWAKFVLFGDLVFELEWYFFLADLTTDFLVNWTSLAYQWSGCQTPGGAFAQGHAIQSITVGTNPGTFIFDEWHPDHQDGMFMDNGSIAYAPGIDGSVGFNLQTSPWPEHPELGQCGWSATLINQDTDDRFGPFNGETAKNGTKNATYMYANSGFDVRGGHWVVEITKDEGIFYCSGGSFTGTGNYVKGRDLLPDP